MRGVPKVTALVCPRCGGGLDGLRHDVLFCCAPCSLALLVEDGRTKLFEVTRAKTGGVSAGGPILWLPFWELDAEVTIADPAGHTPAFTGVAAGIERIWVAGFAVRRPELFGEPGVPLTERQTRFDPAGEGGGPARLLGACRGPALIERYARLTVLRLLDRREDVTGVDVTLRVKRAGLRAVPFEDRGDRLVDLATGASLPAAAFEDLGEMRAVRRRPGEPG